MTTTDRSKRMETISLSELLRRHWNVSAEAQASCPDGIARVDAARAREQTLRRLLPSPLVRRLDAGFARSFPVHPDTGRALYAICRASGAIHVFETGTYWGYSTAYLAAALDDAGAAGANGKVWTFDLYARAGKHIPRGLRPRVALYRGKPSTEMMPPVLGHVTPTLFFQDSRHDYEGVIEELRIVAPHLPPGGAVLFHDFVEPEVRRAATDLLPGYACYVVESQDPQQLGIAVKPS